MAVRRIQTRFGLIDAASLRSKDEAWNPAYRPRRKRRDDAGKTGSAGVMGKSRNRAQWGVWRQNAMKYKCVKQGELPEKSDGNKPSGQKSEPP